MAKKERTAKQLASDQRLKEVAAARREAKTKTQNTPTLEEALAEQPTFDEPIVAPEKNQALPEQTISMSEFNELKKQIEELKQNQTLELIRALQNGQPMTSFPGQPGSGTSVQGGRVLGTFEKYSTDKSKYPSPVERLKGEPRLARFAFPINYELDYSISVSKYQTKEGINTKEPKFSLTLIRVMMDEETGEPSNGRYEICRFIMHEDPEAAMVIAEDNGLTVEAEDEAAFLNEMRYLRMRDWLLECFYPKPAKRNEDKTERVIGGKLVTYYEVNTENNDGPGIDWSKAPKVKF